MLGLLGILDDLDHLISTAYQQQQTPPQQRSLDEVSYQQQSYKVGVLFFARLVFLSLLFIINTSCPELNLIAKPKKSRLK
jgi:hypothetical protein